MFSKRIRVSLWAMLLGFVIMCGFAQDNRVYSDSNDDSGECGPAIGIDLGTTYSCVGVFRDGKVEILANELGSRITPSYVMYPDDNGPVVVGEAAKAALKTSPRNVVFDAKRLIGRDVRDSDVMKDKKNWPFTVKDKDGKLYIVAGSKSRKVEVAPEQVSSAVLSKMKSIAEDYLGKKVCSAVVTVPAYFNDAQRQATRDAGAIAGLDVKRILNEPTSAAIAYGLNNKTEGEKATKILVYDLGGGTFDVSVLNLQDGMFEVASTGGDTHLGGQDFDNRIMEYVVSKFVAENSEAYRPDQAALARLRLEVESAKRHLSNLTTSNISIPEFYKKKNLDVKLSRAKFEHLNAALFQKTVTVVDDVLKAAKLKKSDIDEVVLVGGSTRIPKIIELITTYFGKKPRKGINPDEAVAYGASVQAAVLSNQTSKLIDDVLLLDVTPLTLGIEIHGGMVAPIIPRNSQIPTKKSQIFTTVTDNQSVVSIKVYEGERPLAKDNHLLGDFQLADIPAAPRGVPQIEVSFKVDADGILEVLATDKGTNKSQTKVIKNDSGRLTPDQIDEMLKSSELNAQKDKELKEAIEARNGLESLIYSAKAYESSKLEGKVEKKSIEEFEKVLEEAEKWLVANATSTTFTKEEVDGILKKVNQAMAPIAKAMYSEGSTAGGPQVENFELKEDRGGVFDDLEDDSDSAGQVSDDKYMTASEDDF